jgi:hypothetical protein
VNGYTHRRILADLELQLISELQREEFIDMIKSLKKQDKISDSKMFLRRMTNQFIFDSSLGSTTSTAENKFLWRKKCGRVDGECWS